MSKVDSTLLEETRAILLEGGHGRYEGLTYILTSAELESDKPIVLIKKVSVRLAIDKEKVNYFSFYSWLKTWRQKKKKGQLPASQAMITTAVPFQFTDPSTLISKDTPIIKII